MGSPHGNEGNREKSVMEGETGMFASIPLLIKKLLKMVVRPSSSSSSASEGIAADLRSVKTTWEWTEARLSDAEAKEIKSESVKLWLRELRKLSYDLQDVLDSFHYEQLHQAVSPLQEGYSADFSSGMSNDGLEIDDSEVGQRSHPNLPFFASDRFLKQTEERVKIIRERFDEIRYHKDALDLREDDSERRCDEDENASRWQTSSCRTDTKLFGRENDLNNLVKYLVNDDGDDGEVEAAVKIIVVLGMGGVGKTALAQHACNAEVVRKHFDARGWVCVREHFDLVRLTKAALESFAVDNRDETARVRWCSQACELTQIDPLQNVLAETVQGKKVLLVLDNVWNECPELWDRYLSPLRDDAGKGSKILITTRNHAVANAFRGIKSRIPLGCLSLGDSQKLFRHCAMLGRREPQFRQVADGIISKAGGLPLALKLLGRFLRHENDLRMWKSVLDCDLCKVAEAGKQILEPLQSSYLHLRTALKACFRYWALFPEDHRVDREEVIRLWMAHDLVHDKQGLPLEDIGSQYMKELSLRSLLLPPCGNEVTMHRVVHELAKQISGKECRRMVGGGQLCTPIGEEANHLAILGSSSCQGGVNAQLFDPLRCKFLSSIRSLLFFVKLDHVGGLNHKQIFANMMRLRVLDLSYSCLKNLPSTIENLKHLRYLKLAGTGLQELPESVSKLYHLQTLDLGSATCLVQLPSSIDNLKRLRYLNLRNTKIDTWPDCIHDMRKRHSLRIEFPTSSVKLEQIEENGNSSRSSKRGSLSLEDELITNKRVRCSSQNEQEMKPSVHNGEGKGQ